MQKLFRQEVRFKADDGSDFPDWEEKTLGDICMYERQRSEGANFIGTENMLKDFGGVAFDNSKADGSGTKGSKMPRGDKKHIMEMPLLLPNKDEQRKIDDCLSSLNDVIIKAKNELAKWQELKKGLLQQMFV